MNKSHETFSLFFAACFLLLIFSNTFAFTIPVFPVPESTSPFAGVADAAINGYNQGIQSRLLKEQLKTQQLQNQMMEQQLAQKNLQEKMQPERPLKIMIFSQKKYPTYLGCVNCPYFTEDSIHNDGNSFGSEKGRKSIFNTHNLYGSKHSNLSVCNPHATRPPIIVDNRGTIYGLLTLNTRLRNAIDEPKVLEWLETRVCKTK